MQLFTVWTGHEDSALVEFVLLTRPDQSCWPADKSTVFWDRAAQYVFIRSGSGCKRTGKFKHIRFLIHTHVHLHVGVYLHFSGTSCHSRVTKVLTRTCESPLHAEVQLCSSTPTTPGTGTKDSAPQTTSSGIEAAAFSGEVVIAIVY